MIVLIFEDVDTNLGIMQSGPREEYKQAFHDLLDEAVKLDKEVSRQVACVVWTFETKVGTRAFDPVTMELYGAGRRAAFIERQPRCKVRNSTGGDKAGQVIGRRVRQDQVVVEDEGYL